MSGGGRGGLGGCGGNISKTAVYCVRATVLSLRGYGCNVKRET